MFKIYFVNEIAKINKNFDFRYEKYFYVYKTYTFYTANRSLRPANGFAKCKPRKIKTAGINMFEFALRANLESPTRFAR
jgi:hypothetical protein